MRISVRALALLGSGLLSLSAAADPASAPSTEPAVRRVVGTTLSATQAALLDEDTGEYRLVRLGDEINGAHVVAIGEGEVTLLRGGAKEQLALAADPRPRVRMTLEPMVIRMRPAAPVAVAAAAPQAAPPVAVAAPIAPTPPVAVAAPIAPTPPVAVAAPIAPTPPVAVAAPIAPSGPVAIAPTPPPAPVAVEAAPVVAAAPTPPPAPANNGAPRIIFVEPLIPPPQVPAPVSTPAPVAPAEAPVTTVPRAELDRGLGNFAALDASVQLELAPQGGFRVANLVAGSFLEKLGLHRGDVIERVDGRPLRGVDDASAAYNWVRVTDHFAVELLRDGRPITLKFQITA